jgi:nicotinate-nucleotide pyrophosphorylase
MLSLPPNLAQQVTIALVEDIGSGDVTAELVPADQRVEWRSPSGLRLPQG